MHAQFDVLPSRGSFLRQGDAAVGAAVEGKDDAPLAREAQRERVLDLADDPALLVKDGNDDRDGRPCARGVTAGCADGSLRPISCSRAG